MSTEVRTPQCRCRFGLAVGDVTPPVGMYHRMWGAAAHEVSTGIHRPLRASAMAVGPRGGADVRILVAVDHCILGVAELERLLTAIEREAAVEREAVLVCCSHTHAAGLLSLDRVDQPGGELIPAYLEELANEVGRLAAEAKSRMADATIVYGQGRCGLAAFRDYWDAAGGRYVCGFDPDTPADDTVLVARAFDVEGGTLGTLVNYACHPTTLAWENTLVSPDFPGATRELVEGATGGPCVFLQGASGELGPREGFLGDAEVADRNGRILGHAALAAIESLPAPDTVYRYAGPVVSGATIGTWQHEPIEAEQADRAAAWSAESFTIPLAYREDLETAEEIEAQLAKFEAEERRERERGDAEAAADSRARAERKRRALARRRNLPAGETFPYAATLWRMGEAVWVGVQGEPYSLLQTALRERFPGTPLVVASLGYSWNVGYLPPRETYGKGVYQEGVAVVAAGSLERVVEELGERIGRVGG